MITPQDLMNKIVEITNYRSLSPSKNGFGFGFYRWVSSAELKDGLGCSFADIRKSTSFLLKRRAITIKRSSGGYNQYAIHNSKWVTMNDYFMTDL